MTNSVRRVFRFIREVAAPALLASWIVYLGYGAIAGAAGYRALDALRAEAQSKQQQLTDIRARREALSHRARLLNPQSLDPDMIDERIRAVLGYARQNDIVLPRSEIDRLLKSQKAPLE